MTLELRHLQTLVALAEEGTLTHAGHRVYLSQSALSHQIRLLEQQYEAALFERKSQPLRWTPVGQRLLKLAYDVQHLVADAERDVRRLREGKSGELRIAVECHSCFDWLMPSMDRFREEWPEVELDLVSGFHADPVALLEERADFVVVSQVQSRRGVRYHPLFRFEIAALVAREHRLAAKPYVTPEDFAEETLITYPVPDDLLDIIREVLRPAGVNPARRTTALTVAILQLVASRRGVAALPRWAVEPYLNRSYVVARPITANGLQGQLYAVTTPLAAELPYMRAFLTTVKGTSITTLDGMSLLQE